MEIKRNWDVFDIMIGSKDLSRGLRISKRNPRNSGFLTTCSGAVGRDGVLQILDELTRMQTGIRTLAYDAQTGSFTVGNTIYQTIAGVTVSAKIVRVHDAGGGEGLLWLEDVSGTFQNDEIIYESALGGELISKGDFESGFTGGIGNDWAEYSGGNTYAEETIIKHGGGSAQKITVASEPSNAGLSQSITITSGNFYRISQWVYLSTLMRIRFLHAGFASYVGSDDIDGSSWYNWIRYERATSTSTSNFYVYVHSSYHALGDIIRYDDVSVKQVTNAALANGALSTDYLESFPYPQIFVFTNLIIVCTQTIIYEWVDGLLVEKLNIGEENAGSTWCAVDYHNYIYLSNAYVAVEKSSIDGSYAITTDLPPAMSMCDYHGQVVICGLDGDIFPISYWDGTFPGWQEPVILPGGGED